MMVEKVIVNYDEVMRMFKFREKINKTELKNIEWVKDDGSSINIDDRLIEEWKFIGLNNCDFARDYITEILEGNEEELLKGLMDAN